jgi:hypothetical protein
MTPDMTAIPIYSVDDTWADKDVTAFYCEMRKIGEEYAANTKWAGDR